MNTAIILVGGLGTRLRPLTDHTPKPLLPIKNKPTMQHIIENLAQHNINNIILSIGYKADQIKEYFQDGSQLGVHLTYIYEDQPLGTGGAVKFAASTLPQNEPFYLAWGDNLMDINWTEMHNLHQSSHTQITMALTPREDVENFGVAKLDQNKIIQFIEKPPRHLAPSNLINAGAFIINPQALNILPKEKSSIEKDCFEFLAPQNQITAYIHPGQWFPTDTLEKYYHANEHFQPYINLKEKNIIIADVDDTICNSCQQISQPMANQINHMIQHGYQFAFISGTKNIDLQQMLSSRITQPHHLLGTTGTQYVHIQHNQPTVIYTHTFTQKEKHEITTALNHLITHYNIQSHTTKEDQLQDRESQITLSAIGRHAPSEIKAQYDPNGKKRLEWITFLTQQLDETKYDIKIGGTTSLDITRKGLNKEWGIRQFLNHNNYLVNQVLFFGDKLHPGGNDYPATRIVDCIAVKNTQETLQKLKEMCP